MTSLRVTYFDTAMVLIEIAGLRLLTDPVLDPQGTVIDDGPVRLVKVAAPTVTAEALGHIDAVLLSHDQHGDNLDAGGRALLTRIGRVLTTPMAAARLGGAAEGLETWATTIVGDSENGVRITAVPAQHAPDEFCEMVGPVTGFVIEPVGSGSRPIYISGDTIRFSGTEQIARRFSPVGLAILHLGNAQVAPLGPVSLSLSAQEATEYADKLGAEVIIPIHFEGWQHFTQGRGEAREVFNIHGFGDRVRWLDRGASTEVSLSER